MYRFFDPTWGQLPTVPSDKVVALRVFDNLPLAEDASLWTAFLFNNVLDPSKLRASLETLASLEGWNKIGARFRYDKSRHLNYHIPAKFNKDRPAVNFCHIRHDMPIAKHPVASKLQQLRATKGPKILADTNEFQPLWDHPNIPKRFSHYLNHDISQTGLVVVSFNDATIVALSWFHTFFDTPGKAELLHAWSLVVNGDIAHVKTPHDAAEDPLAELGLHPTEPYILEKLKLSWVQVTIFAVRAVYNALFKKYRNRILLLPATFLSDLRRQAAYDLSVSDTWPGSKAPFLSDDNLITAWWAQLRTSVMKNPCGTVNLLNALGLRRTLQEDLLPSSKPYLSNAVGFFPLLIPAQELIAQPRSHVAALMRQRITECRTRQQVEAYAALVREKKGTLTMPMFGDATMTVLMGTSWCNGKLFQLDFSQAVIRTESVGAVSRSMLSFPSYIQYNTKKQVCFDLATTIGKDQEGNYWLNITTDDFHWKRIEQALNKGKE
ncbi:hypothetical protein QQS21_003915 [Conoideocrella luteorostrata]|uniref:LysR family regulatory protein n=1 Tax=Conoideocrella luteorostrata TaxID=1105319 RepID=A0AAJ0FVY3_9HYPO|nr:hypothetical protein QQS21_003915 [Conoideocrella luteorostrata]